MTFRKSFYNISNFCPKLSRCFFNFLYESSASSYKKFSEKLCTPSQAQQSKITEICIEQLFRSRERSSLSLQYLLFLSCKHRSDSRIVVETITQMFVYRFIHPVFSLFVAAVIKVSVLLHKVDITVHHVPDLLDSDTIKNPEYVSTCGVHPDSGAGNRCSALRK